MIRWRVEWDAASDAERLAAYMEVAARLDDAERDAERYRWIHDNIDWVDDVGYVIYLTLLPADANEVALFQYGVDAAMGAE